MSALPVGTLVTSSRSSQGSSSVRSKSLLELQSAALTNAVGSGQDCHKACDAETLVCPAITISWGLTHEAVQVLDAGHCFMDGLLEYGLTIHCRFPINLGVDGHLRCGGPLPRTIS